MLLHIYYLLSILSKNSLSKFRDIIGHKTLSYVVLKLGIVE